MWVEDTYRESEFVGDDPNWLRQVGIICDEDRHLELLRKGIPKKMRGEVHLRAFLFRLVHPDLLNGAAPSKHHAARMSKEVAVVNA